MAPHLIETRGREGTYRAIMARNVVRLIELLEDVLREDLAKLNTHLIYRPPGGSAYVLGRHRIRYVLTEGVDAPDDTLREDLVLVQRDEGTQGGGREEREDDAVARTVALEDLRLHQRIGCIGAQFLQSIEDISRW